MPSFAYDFAGFGVINATSIATSGAATIGGRTTTAGLSLSIDGNATTPAINRTTDPNTGIHWDSGGDNLRLDAAGGAVHAFSGGNSTALGVLGAVNGASVSGGNLTLTAVHLLLTAGYIQLVEIASPGVGAANTARIFAIDDAAKTEAAIFFATGVRQQIAQEP